MESKLPGKIEGQDDPAYATTYKKNLTELQAGVEHTFTLRQEAKMDKADYSVVALDGRYVEKNNYTIQWLVKNGDNEETTAAENVNPYVTTTTKTGDMYRLWLEPKGDMTVGAYSEHLIVGTKQLVNVTVVASDEIDATEETDVYQLNDITLTATVEGAEPENTMKPTGTVTFYYRTKDTTSAWTEIGEAALAEDSVTGKMVATLVTDELPVDAEAYTKARSPDLRDLQWRRDLRGQRHCHEGGGRGALQHRRHRRLRHRGRHGHRLLLRGEEKHRGEQGLHTHHCPRRQGRPDGLRGRQPDGQRRERHPDALRPLPPWTARRLTLSSPS